MRILHGAPIEHARRARSNPSAFDAFDPAATDFKIGNGIPNKVVALRGNSTLRLADPRNLIVATLDGIGAVNSPHRQSMQAIPRFSDKLCDGEVAALANYLRVT